MARWLPAALVAGTVMAVVLTMSGHESYAGSGDDPHYLVIAESLALDGDLDLANNYRRAGPTHRAPLDGDARTEPGKNGVLRPLLDVGLPLIVVPGVRAAAAAGASPETLRRLVTLLMAFLTGCLAAQLMAIFGRGGASVRGASAWALLLSLSPPLLSYSFLFVPEIPAALLVTWLFWTLSDPAGRGRALGVLAGLGTGFLLLLDAHNMALAAGFAVWSMAWLRREKASVAQWMRYGFGLALPILLRFGLYVVFWDVPFDGVAPGIDWRTLPGEVLSEVFVRLSGLFFDQEFGVLPYAPLYLLMLPGLVRINERRYPEGRALVRIVAIVVACVALPYVNTLGWVGGWTPAGRMLTPIAPLLGVAVFTCARRLTGWARRAAAGLVAVQIVIDVLIWLRPALLWNDGDGTNDFFASLPALQRVLPVWHGAAPSPYPFVVAGLLWGAASFYLARNAKLASASSRRT